MTLILSADMIEHPYRVVGQFSPQESRKYCEKLAKSHYENFLIAGVFCPKPLRQHFYNVYAYCRVSDDLGDEIGDTQKSLILLNWWEDELDAMYSGSPRHPVFVALKDTVAEYGIPAEPFRDLLTAFRQDQTTTRYNNFEQLLDYCKNSANPVGRLVLYLCGYSDAERLQLSDQTCTALQLANFWQDVARDLDKDRVYLPLDDMERFGYTEKQLFAKQFTPEFAALLKFEVSRTREIFAVGAKLGGLVEKRVRLDVEMFSKGGQEVLRLIESQGYDVLTKRPAIRKSRQIQMLFGRMFAGIFSR